MAREKEADQAPKLWSLEGIEGAALRKGREKHLDKELEMPPQQIYELHVPVLEEMHAGLQEIIGRHGWEEEEGLRTILAAGLGYLRALTLEEMHEGGLVDDNEYNARLHTLHGLLAKYEAQYSVMKFKAYQFQEKSRILEMRVSGLEGTERFREAWALRIRDRLEALQAEHEALEQRLAQCEQTAQPSPERQAKLSSWWDAFRALLQDFKVGGQERDGDTGTTPRNL